MTHIPYGYRIENAVAIPDEVEAQQIRDLYEEYIKSGSMIAAAKLVGIKKTHSMVGRMLQNEVYLGTDFYPRLIDDETFAKAQEQRQWYITKFNRNREPAPKEKRPANYHFAVGSIKKQHDDPYLQAEYAYSQIEEVVE